MENIGNGSFKGILYLGSYNGSGSPNKQLQWRVWVIGLKVWDCAWSRA